MNSTKYSPSPWERLKLDVFKRIAPAENNLKLRSWRILKHCPKIWLSPSALRGMRVLIHPTDWSQTVIFSEVFELNNYDLTRLAFVPSHIVDCGAHIGMFSLLASAHFPKARSIAFEPDPSNAAMLRKQFQRNRLSVEMFPCAVAASDGEEVFVIGNSHSGHLGVHPWSGQNRVKVKMVGLPQFIRELRATKLLLKLDVEGEEMQIFPPLLPILPEKCAIFFETHSGQEGWDTINTLLSSAGFKVEQLSAREQFCDGYAVR
jgi:FkbM family methyltransferase